MKIHSSRMKVSESGILRKLNSAKMEIGENGSLQSENMKIDSAKTDELDYF